MLLVSFPIFPPYISCLLLSSRALSVSLWILWDEGDETEGHTVYILYSFLCQVSSRSCWSAVLCTFLIPDECFAVIAAFQLSASVTFLFTSCIHFCVRLLVFIVNLQFFVHSWYHFDSRHYKSFFFVLCLLCLWCPLNRNH